MTNKFTLNPTELYIVVSFIKNSEQAQLTNNLALEIFSWHFFNQ